MGCNCGKPKCNGKCGCKSPAVLQINNPAEYITFHKVVIPASLGDSKTYPPRNGMYRNVLAFYEADQTSWLYSTDGIPTKLTNGITDYEDATNLPQINGNTLIGDKTGEELGLQNKLTAGDNIQIDSNNVISATDTTYTAGEGIEISAEDEISAKLGDSMEFGDNGEIDVKNPVPDDFFDGEISEEACGTSAILDNMIGGVPASFELKGDTYQQSYVGKNLANVSAFELGGISNTGAAIADDNYFHSPLIPVVAGTSYTASAIFPDETADKYIRIAFYDSNESFISRPSQESPHTATAPANASFCRIALMKAATDIQLEAGSTATTYEPYVGGVPSPNPDYPQQIQTVTGEQIVSINNVAYKLDLGDIELNNIAGFRDRIYADEDGIWKIHKTAKKYVFKGDTSVDNYFFNTDLSNVIAVNLNPLKKDQSIFKNTDADYPLYSDLFNTKRDAATNSEHLYITQAAAVTGGWRGNIRMYVSKSRLTGYSSSMTNAQKLALAVSWLQNNNLTVYYIPIVRDEDYAVQDEKLLSQLNSIRLSTGTNNISVTSDGLTAEICIGGYKNNWNGAIADINNELNFIEDNYYDKMGSESLPLSEINLKNIATLRYSEDDLYQGYGHSYLQGFCYANGNAICALRSTVTYEDYVRLVEYDLSTHTVVREEYLELAHANSLSYREDTKKIYVAACNHASSGSTVADNRIFVVDYDSFTIEKTINISNIPSGHRIRSVWYDNDEKVLYAGDVYDMFVIDEDQSIITKTIPLERDFVYKYDTNQTLKKIGDTYVGVFVTFLAVWGEDGRLIRMVPINQLQNGEHVGEIEDCDFDEKGNLLIAAIHHASPRTQYYNTEIYRSHLSKNVNITRSSDMGRADTSALSIHVNSESTSAEEDGSSARPFKDLQRAVNIAKGSQLYTTIYIDGGSYDYVYINGVYCVSFSVTANTVIDGLEIANSRVILWNDSTATLTVNGLSASFSDVRIDIYGGKKLTINPNDKSGTSGYGYCVWSRGGHIKINDANLVGNNGQSLVRISDGCMAALISCSYDGYTGYYAVSGGNGSIILLYESVFNKAVSSTEHTIFVETGARLYHRNALRSKNHFVIQSQAMVYPTAASVEPTNKYYGDVCSLDMHYSSVMLVVRYGGEASLTKNVIFDNMEKLDNATIDTTRVTASGTRICNIRLSYSSNTLSIAENSMIQQPLSGTATYDSLSNNTPTIPTDWASIEEVIFFNM